MHILAISGSLRASSTSTTIIHAIEKLAPEQMNFTLYDGLADLPHFSPDLDGEPPHAAVAQLRQQLQSADGILICTPEYAFGVPGSLKNALDWVVSSGDFVGKPVVAVSSSPSGMGGDKALASLVLTLTAIDSTIVEGGIISIAMIRTKMQNGEISDAATVEALRSALAALAQAINVHA